MPAGVSDEGAPRGATFVAGRKEDEKLLNIAYSFEKKTAARAYPRELPELEPPLIDEHRSRANGPSWRIDSGPPPPSTLVVAQGK